MVKQIIDLKEQMLIGIYNTRLELADKKKEKIDARAKAWETAEGIADAKKDYVRSQVSDIQNSIDVLEAEIELAYNQIKILDMKMELEKATDE